MTIKCPNNVKGQYFGASLLSLGDCLLVGAPLYSESIAKRQNGRVYVYCRVRNGQGLRQLRKLQEISPKEPKKESRFGSTMTSIDLNKDGHLDVIISAPGQQNEDGSTGAVYAYYGKANKELNIKSVKVRLILDWFNHSKH